MGFGDRLRAARQAAGLTQAELARLVGVADGTRVAAWEHGRSKPRPLTLVKLQKTLDLPAEESSQDAQPSSLGVTLRQLRLARNMTTEELSDLLQVHETTVVRWESGATKPRKHALRNLAQVLGIGVHQLPQ